MVYLSKDTVDIYCFFLAKIDMKRRNEHLLCKMTPVSLKQIEKFLHFFSVESFSDPKPHPLGKDSWAKTRPPGSTNVRIPGGRPGVGWSGLELTDR